MSDFTSSVAPERPSVVLTQPIVEAGPTGATAAEPIRVTVARRHVRGQLALIWMGMVVAAILLQPVLPLPDPLKSDYGAVGQAPFRSWDHLLGTDEIGRDILARAITGARISLIVGVGAVAIAICIGMLLGVAAGYFGGPVNRVVSAVTDVMLAFPALVLLIAVAVFAGPGLVNLTVAIGVVGMPQVLRVARASTLTYARRDFVTAARGMGSGPVRIMVRELLPNVVIPVIAYGMVMVAVVIVAEGGLSFLGLGVPPPTSSWGSMIAGGRPELSYSPHIALVPAAIMFVTLLSLNVLGDRISRRFEVRESVL